MARLRVRVYARPPPARVRLPAGEGKCGAVEKSHMPESVFRKQYPLCVFPVTPYVSLHPLLPSRARFVPPSRRLTHYLKWPWIHKISIKITHLSFTGKPTGEAAVDAGARRLSIGAGHAPAPSGGRGGRSPDRRRLIGWPLTKNGRSRRLPDDGRCQKSGITTTNVTLRPYTAGLQCGLPGFRTLLVPRARSEASRRR